MIDKDSSFEVEHGLDVYDPNDGNQISGPFYTGGPSEPLGLNLPEESIYVQNKVDGIVLWRKFGNSVNDWAVHDDLKRTDPINHDVNVPAENILQLFNREINGELYVDGEVYVV